MQNLFIQICCVSWKQLFFSCCLVCISMTRACRCQSAVENKAGDIPCRWYTGFRRHRKVCAKPVYWRLTPQGRLRKAGILASDVLRVKKAYADRIKYKTATGIILNIATIDRIFFTFPTAKAFASGNIKICEMWAERLADVWIATSSPMFASEWPGHSQVFKRPVPYDILHRSSTSGWTRNFRLDYIELP